MTNQEQDIQLLNEILNRNYYYYFKQDNNKRRLVLQFFQNSNYDNSWIIPTYETVKIDKKEIINNFELLLNWYKKNNFKCDIQIDDFFWLNDIDFREQIFNILYKTISDINLYITNSFSNLNEQDFEYFNNQKIKFKTNNVNIIYTILVEDIYNNELLNFGNKNNSIIKVKISPNSVSTLNQDYLYLIKNYDENNIVFYEEESQEWTEEKIQLFIKFIDFYFEYQIKNYKQDQLLNNIFFNNNFIFSLSNKGTIDETNPYGKCKLYHNLNITVFNLGINFCKKFQYNDLTIGYYQIENNEITKCLPNNIPAAMVPTHTKRYILPQCEYCHYGHICNGYCHGDAYKLVMNPLIPILETCNLKKAKFTYILYKLKQLKLFNIKNIEDKVSSTYIEHLIFLYNRVNYALSGGDNTNE